MTLDMNQQAEVDILEAYALGQIDSMNGLDTLTEEDAAAFADFHMLWTLKNAIGEWPAWARRRREEKRAAAAEGRPVQEPEYRW
jgi:hypothetical protein